jgi:hypothetical protein
MPTRYLDALVLTIQSKCQTATVSPAKPGDYPFHLSVRRQCAILGVRARACIRKARPTHDNVLEATRDIDALFTARPFVGARRRRLHQNRIRLPKRRRASLKAKPDTFFNSLPGDATSTR